MSITCLAVCTCAREGPQKGHRATSSRGSCVGGSGLSSRVANSRTSRTAAMHADSTPWSRWFIRSSRRKKRMHTISAHSIPIQWLSGLHPKAQVSSVTTSCKEAMLRSTGRGRDRGSDSMLRLGQQDLGARALLFIEMVSCPSSHIFCFLGRRPAAYTMPLYVTHSGRRPKLARTSPPKTITANINQTPNKSQLPNQIPTT